MFVDYYSVLGIRPESSSQDIKRAYRIQAMKWHPDKNPGKDTNEKMVLINEAYCVLRDPEIRARYDAERARYYEQLNRSQNFNNNANRSQYEHKDSANESNHSPFHKKDPDTKNSDADTSSDYIYSDTELSEWISRAKSKARELAKQSLDDLVGIASVATTNFARGIRDGVVIVLVGTLVSILLFLISG